MLSIMDVIEATGGTIANPESAIRFPDFTGVSIDSRTIKSGELFIALRGDRFDGHDFAEDAIRTGRGAIVNSKFRTQDLKIKGKPIIVVNDTLSALHYLARHIRKEFKGHVIGVVGSNGKTTTKEMISSILRIKLNVHKTKGNLNNHIGVPISITEMDKSADVLVLEMGTNRPGDIDDLCNIALPDIGVVTNIGYEHLQGFDSLHKVRESELEIMPYVNKLIVNADDAFLMEEVRNRTHGTGRGKQEQTITFGIETQDADIIVRDIVFSENGTRFVIAAGDEYADIDLKTAGRFNVYNSLAAASAAYAMGFRLSDIKTGLESFAGVDMRFEIKRERGATFLNDVYNANPSSMEESINELIRFAGAGHYKRAIAVLGDMLELGDYSVVWHKKLGQRLSELPINIFVGVGQLMSLAISEFKGKGIYVGTSDDAGKELARILEDGDIVLIKGSRGIGMEKVMTVMLESCSEDAIGFAGQHRR